MAAASRIDETLAMYVYNENTTEGPYMGMWPVLLTTSLHKPTSPLPTHCTPKGGAVTFLDVSSVHVLLHRVDVSDFSTFRSHMLLPFDLKAGGSTLLDINSVLVLLPRVYVGDIANVSEAHYVSIFRVRP
jgi:hypothetical protein